KANINGNREFIVFEDNDTSTKEEGCKNKIIPETFRSVNRERNLRQWQSRRSDTIGNRFGTVYQSTVDLVVTGPKATNPFKVINKSGEKVQSGRNLFPECADSESPVLVEEFEIAEIAPLGTNGAKKQRIASKFSCNKQVFSPQHSRIAKMIGQFEKNDNQESGTEEVVQ
ncbi:hypothetical protein CBL_13216, partial [Carabus blaptoides fortunei]